VQSPDAVEGSGRWTLLLAVALVALVLRLVYIWQISHAPFASLRLGDARAYHQWALRIAQGDWLGQDVFYQAPLYPYFLAAVYQVFGDGAAMVRFTQAVVGAGSCMLLASAGMALFGSRGAVAGLLLAVYPPAIFLDGLLEKSALVTFFTAALLYLLSARHVRGRALLAGAVLGLLSLTRENALLLAVPVVSWFLIGERKSLSAALFLAGCLVVLLPVGARNYRVGGEFHLTTSQFGPNFYIGNHAGARGLYEPLVAGHGDAANERDDAIRLAEQTAGHALSPDEVSAFWAGRALEFIRAQPGAWLGLLGRKLALTYNAVEIADTESQEVYAEWSPILRSAAPLTFGVILGLAAFGIGMTLHEWSRLWFLYAIAATYTLSVVVFYVFARYRLPLVPVLMLLATGGVAAWRAKAARPMRRRALAAGVLAAGFAYLPLEDTRADRIAHHVNVGNALLEDSEAWDQAAASYEMALKVSPQSPAAHLGMGTLMVLRQRPKDAVVHFRTAVDGWPDNTDLRLNYASALSALGEHQAALDQLDAAARLRPTDPTAHLLAGQLLIEWQRADEAIDRYRRALEVAPQNAVARSGLERASQLQGGVPGQR
jgi:tetratricopeptide (TPR) repeat protein